MKLQGWIEKITLKEKRDKDDTFFKPQLELMVIVPLHANDVDVNRLYQTHLKQTTIFELETVQIAADLSLAESEKK